jgi:hypothetical protein
MLIHANGDYYNGEWQNGLKHGYGTYDLGSTGLKYEGFWKNVRSAFTGANFVQDKKHGTGEIIYPDGSHFKGQFRNDEPVNPHSSASKEIRRRSTGYRIVKDGESVDSVEIDGGSSLGSFRGSGPGWSRSKHERSRSFVDTVGRQIQTPQL